MKNIYGTVGYTFFYSKEKPNFILILSDIHSKLNYCENFIEISEWMKNNMNNINILLEEVSREDFVLGELWGSSEHTQNLKNLFLENQKIIHDIDIRPYIVPYSWELLKEVNNNTSKYSWTLLDKKNDNSSEMLFKDYIDVVNQFLYFKLDKIKNKIPNVYNKTFLSNHPLYTHLKQLRAILDKYLIDHLHIMYKKMIDVYTNHRNILEELNVILDSCMEWFIIAKMYELNLTNNKNIIIHTGLFHSERVNNLLETMYNYKKIYEQGLNTIDAAEDAEVIKNTPGCIVLPNMIEKLIE
jgi:hypothetical protein